MVNVGTRTKRPLPDAFVLGLREVGFRPMALARDGLPPIFRHPEFPMLFVEAVPMNTPGETRVVASWNGQATPIPIDPDELVERLRKQCDAFAALVERKTHVNPFAR